MKKDFFFMFDEMLTKMTLWTQTHIIDRNEDEEKNTVNVHKEKKYIVIAKSKRASHS